jgi:hypothetical protein
VVPANVAYPTDSGLLAKPVRRMAATGRRIRAAGGATRTRLRDRSRAAGRRAHAIAAKLRLRSAAGRDEAQATVRRITGELADLAERAAADAERLLANARRALRRARAKTADLAVGDRNAAAGRRRGRLQRAVDDLTNLLTATRTIAAQTRQRLAGITPDGATRRVSLHDPAARPIAKGRQPGSQRVPDQRPQRLPAPGVRHPRRHPGGGDPQAAVGLLLPGLAVGEPPTGGAGADHRGRHLLPAGRLDPADGEAGREAGHQSARRAWLPLLVGRGDQGEGALAAMGLGLLIDQAAADPGDAPPHRERIGEGIASATTVYTVVMPYCVKRR